MFLIIICVFRAKLMKYFQDLVTFVTFTPWHVQVLVSETFAEGTCCIPFVTLSSDQEVKLKCLICCSVVSC